MDLDRLDTLARLLAPGGSRRRLLGLLTVPVVGGLLIPDREDAEAKDRRRRRKGRHKKRRNQAKGKRRRAQRQRACKPQGKAKVCAGTCGIVKNRQTCGKRVDCGSCACIPTTCQAAGKACGQVDDSCGGTLECGTCSGTSICLDGICQACHVCQPPAVCAFSSVQAAIDDEADLETIYVCPGMYVEHAAGYGAVHIQRPLHLIGAGDGENPAFNTILTPGASDEPVIFADQASPITLQGLRVAGSTGNNGVGVHVYLAMAELITCTIAGNDSNGLAGGLAISGPGSEGTLTNSRITGNTGHSAGGVDIQGVGSRLILDPPSRITGNTGTHFGGIRAHSGTSVSLPSAANVTGNTSSGGDDNCGGDGDFEGAGAVCTGA